MDVHQATISVAVRDAVGKLVMESIVETKAATILDARVHAAFARRYQRGKHAACLVFASL